MSGCTVYKAGLVKMKWDMECRGEIITRNRQEKQEATLNKFMECEQYSKLKLRD
jgi:hypothetical protein